MDTTKQIILSIRIAQSIVGLVGVLLAMASLFASLPFATAIAESGGRVAVSLSFLVFVIMFAIAIAIAGAMAWLISGMDDAVDTIKRHKRLTDN